jgi:hypothetical protein
MEIFPFRFATKHQPEYLNLKPSNTQTQSLALTPLQNFNRTLITF